MHSGPCSRDRGALELCAIELHVQALFKIDTSEVMFSYAAMCFRPLVRPILAIISYDFYAI